MKTQIWENMAEKIYYCTVYTTTSLKCICFWTKRIYQLSIVLKWHCHQPPFLVIVNHPKTISLTQNISCLCSAFFLSNINQVCLKYRDFVEQTVIWATTIVDVAVHFPLLCITRNGIARPTIYALSNSQLVNKVLTQGVIQRFKDVNCNLSKLQTFLSNVAKNCRPWHFCAVRDCNLQSRTIKRFSKKSIPILSTRKL